MTLHQWGLILELVGFIVIAFFVGVILAYKEELGVKPLLDGEKVKVARLSNKLTFLRWFKKNNAVTVVLAVVGTLIYSLGLIFQAISTW
jgi:hypothetical protein